MVRRIGTIFLIVFMLLASIVAAFAAEVRGSPFSVAVADGQLRWEVEEAQGYPEDEVEILIRTAENSAAGWGNMRYYILFDADELELLPIEQAQMTQIGRQVSVSPPSLVVDGDNAGLSKVLLLFEIPGDFVVGAEAHAGNGFELTLRFRINSGATRGVHAVRWLGVDAEFNNIRTEFALPDESDYGAVTVRRNHEIIYMPGLAGRGEGEAHPVMVNQDQTHTVLGLEVTGIQRVSARYEFVGWNTAINGSGTSFAPGETISAEDVLEIGHLYAWWERVEHTVTFLRNDGTEALHGTPVSVLYGNTVARPVNDPERASYVFVDWFTSADGAEAFDFAEAVTEDLRLYARWVEEAFAVTYTSGDGEGEPHVVSGYLYEDMHTVLDIEDAAFDLFVAPEGYTFVGWYLAGEAELLQAGDEIEVIGNVTLVAVWEQVFTLTFNLYNEEEWGYIVVPVIPGEAIVLPDEVLEIGHVFSVPGIPGRALWGWFDAEQLDPDVTDRALRDGRRRPVIGDEGWALDEIELELGDFDAENNFDLFAIWSLWGDVNDDGDVCFIDFEILLSYLTNNLPEGVSIIRMTADVNIDGNVCFIDFEILLNYLTNVPGVEVGRPAQTEE